MSANNRRRLTAAYWAGREGSTVRAYESAFRILRFICIEEDLNLGKLDEPARCLIMMRLEEMGKKEGTLKMVLAVIALIREAMGLEANEGTRIEKKCEERYREENEFFGQKTEKETCSEERCGDFVDGSHERVEGASEVDGGCGVHHLLPGSQEVFRHQQVVGEGYGDTRRGCVILHASQQE